MEYSTVASYSNIRYPIPDTRSACMQSMYCTCSLSESKAEVAVNGHPSIQPYIPYIVMTSQHYQRHCATVVVVATVEVAAAISVVAVHIR